MKEITLVTGATGGVGVAFSRELASRGERLLLTGRSIEKLTRLRDDLLAMYPTEIWTIAADLSDGAEREKIANFLQENDLRVGRLINVAGVDIQKGIETYTQEKIAFQCRTNFEAAVSLCKVAIDYRSDALEILNVSSVSGIYPMPYFAIYSATKSALTSFSIALREEMKGKGVKVTAVLPGAMPTREDIREQIKGQGLWGKIATKSPAWVAKKSLNALSKNKRTYIPGLANKLMHFFTKLIPLSWKLAFIAKRWGKISKDAF